MILIGTRASVVHGRCLDRCDCCEVVFLNLDSRNWYNSDLSGDYTWDICKACARSMPKVHHDAKYFYKDYG